MKCDNCGNEKAHRLSIVFDKKYGKLEICNDCGDLGILGIPDVSDVHEPYFDEHLRTKENPNGTMIHSRNQKARILNQLGLREKRESDIKYYSDPKKRRAYCIDRWGNEGAKA